MNDYFSLPIYKLEYSVYPKKYTTIRYWLGAYLRNNLLYAASYVMLDEGYSLLDMINDSGENDIPKGFSIQADPIFQAEDIDRNCHLRFSISLFGFMIKYAPAFDIAVNIMCDNGLGHPQTPLVISECYQYPVKEMRYAASSKRNLRVSFITPISLYSNRAKSIEKQGILDKQNGIPTFYHLACFVARRLNRLKKHYDGGDLLSEEEIEEWCFDARKAQIEDCELRRIILQGTPKQNTRKPIYFSGYVGYIDVSKVEERFLPLLYLGQFINVGNDTAYGIGQYELSY